MPNISEEKYARYLKLSNHNLNEQLDEAVKRRNYDKIRSIISDDELQSIDDKVYGTLFLNEYPKLPNFLLMLKNSDLGDIVNFFIQRVPSKFLCGESSRRSLGHIPYINFVFSYTQNSIPNLLKTISESNRDDIIMLGKVLVSSLERTIRAIEDNGGEIPSYTVAACSPSYDPQDYYCARDAIKKYCVQNDNGDYEIISDYLYPVRNQPKELKQLFIGIATAIECNSLDEVQSSLKAIIEANVFKAGLAITNEANVALSLLARKAKHNTGMVRAISDLQADITFPETFFEESVLCTNSAQKSKN